MPDKQPTEGQLFSRTYLERGAPLSDSKRFRKRLGTYLEGVLSSGYGSEERRTEFARLIERELGASVPSISGYVQVRRFFEEAGLRDLLDSITLTLQFLGYHVSRDAPAPWYEFVKRALREENLSYSLDSKGGVHYLVDEEFENNRVSALSCLTTAKYKAVAGALDAAFKKLDLTPPDTKGAVRDTFEAMEILFKLLSDSNKDLDESALRKALLPNISKTYQAIDQFSASVAEQLFHGLCQWVNAGHKYRHGQKTEELVAPQLEIAVLYLSNGAAYIRWLPLCQHG